MMRRLPRGAVWGAVAWLIYGAVELILSTGFQLARVPDTEILGWQWRLIAMLLGTYVLIGFVLGAIGGMIVPATPQIFASLTITLAFLFNLLAAWPLPRSDYIALGVAALLLLTLPQRKFQFVASPWTVSLLLLASPWVSGKALESNPSAVVKAGLSLLTMGAIVGAAAMWSRLRNGRAPALASQAVLALLAIGIFAAVVEIAERPGEIGLDRAAQPVATGKPNLLMITMDTVRADHTSLYGYERDTTPNLRKLARTATVYTRAIATSDFTLPTHASIFTGAYPEWHGAMLPSGPDGRHEPLRSSQTTLAEIMRAHGYWTLESVANTSYLSASTGLARGFAVSEMRNPVLLSNSDPFYLRNAIARLLNFAISPRGLYRTTCTAEDISRRGLTMLERAKAAGGPFFLFLNYMDAHAPYLPEAPFDLRFSGQSRRFSWDRYMSPARRTNLDRYPPSAAEKSFAISQYDGGIAEEDASIGSVVEELRRLDLYDDTLIVVTADHGESFGERNLLTHGNGFVYGDFVNVPLVIKYPEERESRRSDELVTQADLMPTILSAAEIPAPAGIQGINLLPPRPGQTRTIYSSASGPAALARANARFEGTRRAIFSGPLKLITSTNGPTELYDLSNDPKEEHNLYSPDDPRAADLSRRLDAWVQTMPHENTRPATLDSSMRERLKSLGYVQ